MIPPKNDTELPYFLGVWTVYRFFVRNFSRIAALLSRMQRKEKPASFETLDGNAMNAFTELRETLLRLLMILFPRADFPSILSSNAWGTQTGCVLMQQYPRKQNVPWDIRVVRRRKPKAVLMWQIASVSVLYGQDTFATLLRRNVYYPPDRPRHTQLNTSELGYD